MVQIPNPSEGRVLRHVTLGSTGYRLLTWETNRRCDTGQWLIGYAFYRPGASEPVFCAEDCGVAPSDPVDSDGALRGLLGFLTLREGDTDEEFFQGYSEDQLRFSREEAEGLQDWGMEEVYFRQEGEEPPAFIDIEN